MSHAILRRSSDYPPLRWKRFNDGLPSANDPIWEEITEYYKLSMDARHLQYHAYRSGTSITDANRKLLSDEINEHFRIRASKTATFQMETDIGFIQASMDDYRADRGDMKNNCMETILEDEQLTTKDDTLVRTNAHEKMSPEDAEYLARIRELLMKHEVGNAFRQRLIEIFIQYRDKATKNFKRNNDSRTRDLWRLREEVLLHHYRWRIEKELIESKEAPRKTSFARAVVAKLNKYLGIWRISS